MKQLRQQCQQLLEERGRLEDSPAAMMAAERVLICRGLQKNEESELATKSAQQERDAKDMLQQFEEPLGYAAAVSRLSGSSVRRRMRSGSTRRRWPNCRSTARSRIIWNCIWNSNTERSHLPMATAPQPLATQEHEVEREGPQEGLSIALDCRGGDVEAVPGGCGAGEAGLGASKSLACRETVLQAMTDETSELQGWWRRAGSESGVPWIKRHLARKRMRNHWRRSVWKRRHALRPARGVPSLKGAAPGGWGELQAHCAVG